MTDIEQRLRDEPMPEWSGRDLLDEAADTIRSLTAGIATQRDALRGADERIHSLTEERDRWESMYETDMAEMGADLSRYEEVVKAARALADHAWRLKAYPQGLAGQDKLLGVAQQDIFDLRVLAAKMLNAIDFAALDTEDRSQCPYPCPHGHIHAGRHPAALDTKPTTDECWCGATNDTDCTCALDTEEQR